MTSLTPFQQDALNIDEHISLTANAGSGKTFVLSKRFVEIIIKKNVPLKKIVAITFTEKAASELYKKISNEIENRITNETDSKIVRKLELTRRQLVSANISTIHSFCIDILKEFSPEAGIDANFTPIDNRTTAELIDQSFEELYSSLVTPDEITETLKSVIRLFGSKSYLTNEVKTIIYKRKNVNRIIDEIYSKSTNELIDYFNKTFQAYVEEYFAEDIDDLLKRINSMNSYVLEESPDNPVAQTIQEVIGKINSCDDYKTKLSLFPLLKDGAFTKAGSVRSRGYLSKTLKEELGHDITTVEVLVKDLSTLFIKEEELKLDEAQAEFSSKIIMIFTKVLESYTNKKNENGFLDFEDLLILTEQLTQRKDVLDRLKDKYEFIMIDEYQDTNEIQYNIFMPLLDNLKRGNLFVVGDEKQSIYMFRDADLEIFDKTKNEISSAENDKNLLKLPHSFRVAPQIAAFTNIVFRKLFENAKVKFNEVHYENLVSARKPDEKGSIEFLLAEDGSDEIEAELVVRRILKLHHEENTNLGDCAILFRKRKSFAEVESVLSKYNLPYSILGGKGFYQRQIIDDVHCYLSVLINPSDDLALASILRAPFYSVSDSDLYLISLESGENFWNKLKSYSKKNNSFSQIVKSIITHIEFGRREKPSIILKKILLDTGYWSVVASKKNAKQEIANIKKIIRIADKVTAEGFKTIVDFTDYLKEAINTLEDEGAASISQTDNSVKLMTLHQSKGLEFKSVFLYRCNDKGMTDRLDAKSIAIDKNFGILSKLPPDGKYDENYVSPPLVKLYNKIILKKNFAEVQRLLYVGITRAVNNLYICATVKEKPAAGSTFLNYIFEAIGFPNDDKYELKDSLKFMEDESKNYSMYDEDVRLTIPVTHSIVDFKEYQPLADDKETKQFDTKIINDKIKNDIYSATKLLVFSQCPTKYYLTYNLGYSKLLEVFRTKNVEYDYKTKEDEETNSYGNIKGLIIHSMLEQDVKSSEALIFIKEKLNSVSEKIINKEKFVEEVNEIIQKYYGSEVYKEIKLTEEYENELEVYAKRNDSILYGIVDKLLIKDNEIEIVDYKTDIINDKNVKDKIEHYRKQLMFYAFILKKYFYKDKDVFIRLVFIRKPELSYKEKISKQILDDYINTLDETIVCIEEEKFEMNLTHCKLCHFSDNNNKCLKQVM